MPTQNILKSKVMRQLLFLFIAALSVLGCNKIETTTHEFYINSDSGNDDNDGTSPEKAWKSLERASRKIYVAGDKLMLAKGSVFNGKLHLTGGGSEAEPVTVSPYEPGNGNSAIPKINAQGYLAAVQITDGKNFVISDIELTSDGGVTYENDAKTKRYGVFVETTIPGSYPNIQLKNLKIHHIFSTENVPGGGQNPTSNMGMGIYIVIKKGGGKIKNVLIENCKIEMTGHTGIKISGTGSGMNINFIDSVIIRNNLLKNIGGPGMVPGRCNNVLVQGNVIDHSGSAADPRMHNRGSGIWPWTCNNVLIEKNKFMHARGKNDSCGAHIDFNCNNVVVQYNLSVDNAGGFVEILGNDNNCCYRYNISIDDGFRIKGENKAQKDGHVLWTSGYVGSGNKRKGPFNSYIYNNTIYVKADILSKFDFSSTTNGVLIANNIFYIVGETKDTSTEGDDVSIDNAVFKNNLYQRTDILPESLIITDSAPIIGDPQFANVGGLNPEDYIPSNASVVKNKGIAIEKIPGDDIGLKIGLNVDTDFLGNPISGLPDMGAVEMN
jgi:hypothetical protein